MDQIKKFFERFGSSEQFDVMNVLWIIIILVVAIVVSRLITYLLRRWLKRASVRLKVDATNYRFLHNGITFIVALLTAFTIIYTIPSLRSLAITLFAGAGVFAAVLAFASQQAFSNIIGGIFLVIFKPFRVGDRVTIGSEDLGYVEDITLRHTVVRNFNNNRIIIPNSSVSNATVINQTIEDEAYCRFLEIGISYDSDIDLAMEIIKDEAMKHPKWIDNRTPEEKKAGAPAVDVKVTGFGDSSVNLRGYVWGPNGPDSWELWCDLNKSVKQRFDREGVEIPFPYRTLVYKKDLEQPKRHSSKGA